MHIMGHRGAPADEPENTLRSIRRALAMGVDAVEIDVQLTKDGELAVIHDGTVDRTTNGQGAVKDFTLAELKGLDAGKGEAIPSLAEMAAAVAGKAHLVIELKEPGTAPALLQLHQEPGDFSGDPRHLLLASGGESHEGTGAPPADRGLDGGVSRRPRQAWPGRPGPTPWCSIMPTSPRTWCRRPMPRAPGLRLEHRRRGDRQALPGHAPGRHRQQPPGHPGRIPQGL